MDVLTNKMRKWRHHLHMNPELSSKEFETAAYVANELRTMGIEVTEGIGGTGVVGTLKCGDGKRTIGLRAEMDAIPVTEQTGCSYKSENPGTMHACGHDGHMAMLLGAAEMLSKSRDFNGTVRFIFQPDEETGHGALNMMADGLLERFPMDEIYGAHNMPSVPEGTIATRNGGIMASEDNFTITVKGTGGHAARPHNAKDALVIASEIILAIQTIVSRSIDPSCSSVISCTEIETDGAHNVLAGTAVIKGDTRSLDPISQKTVEDRMRDICEGICHMNGAECDFQFTHEFIPTVNDPVCVKYAAAAASKVVGSENVDTDVAAPLTSEDFGRFLREIPGCFVFFGSGKGTDDPDLHNARFDFNDDILEIGAGFFAQIVRDRLK
ncbi:MAG: amidohydrolase [Firmicutes bacterium]|nr:amidohydrolase [Bacillota bacterium]